jgi:protein TilB
MPSEITQKMLRTRAEHNEGDLTTLEEISLHQQDIPKIEMLEVYCRHLKILYLQNNLIPKMEGLNKLKELEYVNLAVNNIKKIEGIEGCESLLKVDLTLNFIPIENYRESIEVLSECPDFNELYLTGNPCTDWEHYKTYAIAKISTLKRIDGDEITKSNRIQALQHLKSLEQELSLKAQENICIQAGKPFDPDAYSPEMRIAMHEELVENERKREEDSKKNSMFAHLDEFAPKKREGPPPQIKANGQVY